MATVDEYSPIEDIEGEIGDKIGLAYARVQDDLDDLVLAAWRARRGDFDRRDPDEFAVRLIGLIREHGAACFSAGKAAEAATRRKLEEEKANELCMGGAP